MCEVQMAKKGNYMKTVNNYWCAINSTDLIDVDTTIVISYFLRSPLEAAINCFIFLTDFFLIFKKMFLDCRKKMHLKKIHVSIIWYFIITSGKKAWKKHINGLLLGHGKQSIILIFLPGFMRRWFPLSCHWRWLRNFCCCFCFV